MKARNWGRIIFIPANPRCRFRRNDPLRHDENCGARDLSRLAETTAGTGVTVNSVLPGPTASEGVEKFIESLSAASKQTKAESEKEFFRSIRPSSLLRRFARPDEVAPLVVFPLQSASLGNQRRCPQSGWRSCAFDSLRLLQVVRSVSAD